MAKIHKTTFDIIECDNRDNSEENYFDCDELIAASIRKLNLKGYTTKHCCEGHLYDDICEARWRIRDMKDPEAELRRIYGDDLYSVTALEDDLYRFVCRQRGCSLEAYISFPHYIVLPALPDGWEFDGNYWRIAYDYCADPAFAEFQTPADLQRQPFVFFRRKAEVMEALEKWVDQLADYDTVITEEDRKEREFILVTYPEMEKAFLAQYSGDKQKEAAEFSGDLLRKLSCRNDRMDGTIQFPGNVYLPTAAKPAYVEKALREYGNNCPVQLKMELA